MTGQTITDPMQGGTITASKLAVSLALLLLVTLAFLAAYADTLAELKYYWFEGYNWQFLIPVAFVYMVWERRDVLQGVEFRPSIVTGSILLVGSILLLVAGQVSSTQSLREVSIVAAIFSLVTLLFGTETTRRLFWPLVYLILMTSLPTDAIERLREPLKLVSATISAEVLQALGYAVYRESNFLYLPHITLEVADSCSGVNQFTSSIALGIPIAFTMLNKWWKRLLIIAIAAAMGIVSNWVRVILISVWHYHSAKESIHGPYDIYGLPFIFLVGIFFTLLITFAIADKQPPKDSSSAKPGMIRAAVIRLLSTRAFVAAATTGLVILGATAWYLFHWQAQPVAPARPVTDFPMEIAGFQGKRVEKLPPPFYTDVAPQELIANYQDRAGGQQALVYLAYFPVEDEQHELVDYRYNWLHRNASPVSLDVGGQRLQLKRLLLDRPRQGMKKTVYFAYKINGRNPIALWEAKLGSVMDAMLYGRNNGGIVIVIFDGLHASLPEKENRFLQGVLQAAWETLP